MKTAVEAWVGADHMSEREEPDLDHVRKALRSHDERVDADEQPPAEPPEPAKRPAREDDEADDASP
jgi:hypothetical protein